MPDTNLLLRKALRETDAVPKWHVCCTFLQFTLLFQCPHVQMLHHNTAGVARSLNLGSFIYPTHHLMSDGINEREFNPESLPYQTHLYIASSAASSSFSSCLYPGLRVRLYSSHLSCQDSLGRGAEAWRGAVHRGFTGLKPLAVNSLQ